MNDVKYRWILYTIVFVILGTISIQVYWNYKNYLTNKQQFINDVQISLDNAVDSYYENLAKKNTIGFSINSKYAEDNKKGDKIIDSIFKKIKIDSINNSFCCLDSINKNSIKNVSIYRGIKTDSFLRDNKNRHEFWKSSSQNNEIRTIGNPNDTILLRNVEFLTTQIVLSISNDSINLNRMDSLFIDELHRKNITINHGLSFEENYKTPQYLNKSNIENSTLNTSSKSIFLPKNGVLNVHFSNETKIILKRILSGILISTLLILAVISCLFYLLRIIKHQKQLAEVKNDFISNITHEFKTPIATIGVALESIKDFNIIDNKEKTKNYLDMSGRQLSKLNIMVEKLLETATLDSENLNLNKEEINITDLLNLIINKHRMQTKEKTISFTTSSDTLMAKVDAFHFENAINNILDNAIKYGGDVISVDLKQTTIAFTVIISDNGGKLTKADAAHIFDKFYRIPKGNTHDIKGFGIGLYYAKKIVEKHGGAIHLDIENSLTTFKLSFPNA